MLQRTKDFTPLKLQFRAITDLESEWRFAGPHRKAATPKLFAAYTLSLDRLVHCCCHSFFLASHKIIRQNNKNGDEEEDRSTFVAQRFVVGARRRVSDEICFCENDQSCARKMLKRFFYAARGRVKLQVVARKNSMLV